MGGGQAVVSTENQGGRGFVGTETTAEGGYGAERPGQASLCEIIA